jgi:hypothetical protein
MNEAGEIWTELSLSVQGRTEYSKSYARHSTIQMLIYTARVGPKSPFNPAKGY